MQQHEHCRHQTLHAGGGRAEPWIDIAAERTANVNPSLAPVEYCRTMKRRATNVKVMRRASAVSADSTGHKINDQESEGNMERNEIGD